MSWIQTISGKKFDLISLDANKLDIHDIAFSLSMLCRFNGHGKDFYSVAEHSILVSYEINENLALAGLLHDASEAYISDVPAPLKKYLPDFQAYEKKLENLIEVYYGIHPGAFTCAELKRADTQLLVDEKAALMLPPPEPWPPNAPPERDPSRIACLSPAKAREAFLDRFFELSNI